MPEEGERRVRVEFNIWGLRKQLELLLGHELTYEEIARGAGVHPNTIYNLAANRSLRVDMRTIEGLLNYFRREGLEVGIEDLIVVKEA